MKIKCTCGKKAVWSYIPQRQGEHLDFCDDCVPRGCSCNTRPIDDDYDNDTPSNWVEEIDEKGRKLPCCEYWYDENGWDDED